MALNNLTLPEMVEITRQILQKGNPARQAIEEQPKTRGLLTSLRAAHRALFKVRSPAKDPRRAELTKAATEADAAHGLKARGVYAMLTSLAIAEPHGEDYIALRNGLFQSGLKATIQATFVGKAGYATRARLRLTPAVRKRLTAIPLPSGNLLDLTLAWLAAGNALGEVERARARLPPVELGGSTKLAARRQWIGALSVLRAVAKLDPVDAKFDKAVFGLLNRFEEKADQRAAKRTGVGGSREAISERSTSEGDQSREAEGQV